MGDFAHSADTAANKSQEQLQKLKRFFAVCSLKGKQ